MDSDALSTQNTLPLGWERVTCPDPFAAWDTPRDFWRDVFAAHHLAGATSLWDWGECWQTLEEYGRECLPSYSLHQHLLDELRLAFAGLISRSHGDPEHVAGSDH